MNQRLHSLTIGVQLLIVLTILWFGPAVTHAAEKPGPLWPSAPISVSPVEGVIESFWNSHLRATLRWKGEKGVLTGFWDACFFNMQVSPSGGEARMSRSYRIQLGDYQRLRVRLRPGEGGNTTILAEIDGEEKTVAQRVAQTNDALEIAGPIHGG